MSLTWFNGLTGWGVPAWPIIAVLAAHFVVGVGVGACYFGGLWWNACLFANGAHLVAAIGLIAGRFAVLAGFLTLASLEGALPLLLTALGIVTARPLVMRRVKATAP